MKAINTEWYVLNIGEDTLLSFVPQKRHAGKDREKGITKDEEGFTIITI
jgi:hypothetical protein